MPLPSTASSQDTYGGQHVDAHQQEDPATDLMAAEFDQLACDAAAMTRVTRQAWVLFSGLTYMSGTQSIPVTSHRALWGSSTLVRPVVDQTATGVYHVTWPTTVTDELGVVHTLNVALPENPVVYGADGLRAKVLSWTANVLTINAYSAGVLNALNGTQISVAGLMPTFGGFSPFPLRFGGGKRRLQTLYESLNQALGSGYDTGDSSTVTAQTMAEARALDAAYSGNIRMSYVTDPKRCPAEIVPRQEKIFGLRPHRTDTIEARRRALSAKWLVLNGYTILDDAVEAIAGSSFVGIETHPLSTATIRWPVNGYPNSWTSSVAHITVRVQFVASQTTAAFWDMRSSLFKFLRSFLPAWVDFDIAIFDSNGDPCFLLDEPNLDLETFCH